MRDSEKEAEIPSPTGRAGQSPLDNSSVQLQQLRADKIAHYALLFIVLGAAVLFFIMIKAFLVPIILAAVFAGLFFPFYSWVLKRARGRKALSAFVCCAILFLGLLLPAYAVANLMTREAVRLYQNADSKGNGLLQGDLRAKLQGHPLIQKLHLEEMSLQPAFERITKKAAELLSNAIN